MESTEFDATLGGAEELPYSANIFKFAASRSVEIAAMTASVLRPSKSKLIFQHLPFHMRRRVMSHNCKRLPIKLRHGHLEQLNKGGLPPKQKRPSRKYRRRPTNLLDEYNRRKKQNIWLETHIWHAKRFHMVNRWRYRLPYRPCDKAFRACYRATSAHCLLQDYSYCTPIRIQGPLDDIKKTFDGITSQLCGLSVTAKAYTSGNREGVLHLYKPYMYPFGYIGKIQFVWVETAQVNKDLWIFVHPSQIDIVESVLTEVVNKLSCDYTTQQTCNEAKRRKVEDGHFSTINIKIMSGSLNRFCLTGPRAQAVLVNCLKCVSDNNETLSDWISYCNEANTQLHLKEKYDYWQILGTANSPSQLPSRLVLGLVVKDPRLSRPKKRTKSQITYNNSIDVSSLLSIPTFSSVSPLWDDTVRDKIKCNKVTNPQFVEHIMNSQLIPGEVIEDDTALQSIPVVLIQRPGSQNSCYKKIGYGSGWDILIPAGYGLPFWLTFIMYGARSGGLRESENLSFEIGECYLPPDSSVSNTEEKRIEATLKEEYFKLPPSKRINYIKYGIPSPFLCPWKILLKDWCDNIVDDFFVLRDKFHLNAIEDCFNTGQKLEKLINANNCLVAIYIQVIGKGNLRNNSVICMPQTGDITTIETLCEPQHEDINSEIRKIKRLEHRKTLRQLNKIRKKLPKKSKAICNEKSRGNSEPSEYVQQMRELWLPSEVHTVRFVGTRETIGYITKGAYSFSEAKTCGIGYIAYNALCKLLENGFKQVLVRNTSTMKYRLANIMIIKANNL